MYMKIRERIVAFSTSAPCDGSGPTEDWIGAKCFVEGHFGSVICMDKKREQTAVYEMTDASGKGNE